MKVIEDNDSEIPAVSNKRLRSLDTDTLETSLSGSCAMISIELLKTGKNEEQRD